MRLQYRWIVDGIVGQWNTVSAVDDLDGYDEAARTALSCADVGRITLKIKGNGGRFRLQYRRAK